MFKTVEYTGTAVRLIDQTKLPTEEVYVDYADYRGVIAAIKDMVVRGAPAIGVTAGLGAALGAKEIEADSADPFLAKFGVVCDEIADARPTAVNLAWAVNRVRKAAENNNGKSVGELKKIIEDEAIAILNEDLAANKRLGEFGVPLIEEGDCILTHCNAGALATAGDYGTALGVIKAAHLAGKNISVFADETRPLLQGARLTAWELQKEGVPVTLITDSMAGYFMKKGEISKVVVGADRIAANGDAANKIGTYMVAVLAKENNIPFYVAAPVSTVDLSTATGDSIPIEERNTMEVSHIKGQRIAPKDVKIANPAFDVTPNKYIHGIVTDKGVVKPPFIEGLKKAAG